ncbi:MAG TPA: glycosyltransferase family 4 protein [Pyrinomonadaceae bacterium]|nr:glycosyltransferase family 4 protein [Pyrinomonadaceae bacterium]
MKILFALTYYRPHVSGLTVFAARLAEALAARGHEMTVLTSRHRDELAGEETIEGVRVVRVPVAFSVSKGAVMPSYGSEARRLLRAQELVVAHLPATPSEAVVLPILARYGARRPVVAVYYCDVRLPGGLLNRAVEQALMLTNVAACAQAARVLTLTEDYARHSPVLRRFREKCVEITPAVEFAPAPAEVVAAFRRRHAPRGQRLVGMAARFAAEKGVEHLLEALPALRREVGEVKLLFTGDPSSVIGEARYWEQLRPLLTRAGADSHAFLGTLDLGELAAFYGACDVTVLPSTNSTEAFGLVQLESMLCGTPVVASDLPGVRVPVGATGMGRVVPPGDAAALALALADVIRSRARLVRPREEIERLFSFGRMVGEYEKEFERARRGR